MDDSRQPFDPHGQVRPRATNLPQHIFERNGVGDCCRSLTALDNRPPSCTRRETQDADTIPPDKMQILLQYQKNLQEQKQVRLFALLSSDVVRRDRSTALAGSIIAVFARAARDAAGGATIAYALEASLG